MSGKRRSIVPIPSKDQILWDARFWGARDIDHPPGFPMTLSYLLERCGVYPVHGGRAAVREFEDEIRAAYGKYGAELAD